VSPQQVANMASRTTSGSYLGEKPKKRSGRSRSRSPRPETKKQQQQQKTKKVQGYASEGVSDHDIFNLKADDYYMLTVITLVAAIVRIFRIYQPSSVVFDEVQYVFWPAI
jgi:dolichyl-phosphate-mannose-protein mannosyltransferase